MALSNWDTLAVGLNGEPQTGSFVSPGGVKVEIYKNWIYVHDSKAWRKEGSFTKDTIMEISHGNVRYHDVNIQAVRGPQSGVYVVCWHVDYDQKPGERQTADYAGMIGCGVYGFDNEDWVGVKPESVEFLQKWISNKERMWDDEKVAESVANLNNPDITPEDWEKELKETFISDFPDEIAGVRLDMGVRYNQGNIYFAEKVGLPLEESKPGESGEPVIISLIDNMKLDEE